MDGWMTAHRKMLDIFNDTKLRDFWGSDSSAKVNGEKFLEVSKRTGLNVINGLDETVKNWDFF